MSLSTTTHLTLFTLLITTVASQSYTNHTVGGSSGWIFNSATNSTSTDFTKWAAAQTFNLGDYLIFNTTTNSTVIQTYNKTTYASCNTDDASDTDTFYYVGGPEVGRKLVLSVPLTIQGNNYFFSDADDGAQCAHGMAFVINVKKGLGLPPNLNQPPPPAYVAPPPSDSTRSPPSSTVPDTQQETFANGCLNFRGANVRVGVLSFVFVVGLLCVV